MRHDGGSSEDRCPCTCRQNRSGRASPLGDDAAVRHSVKESPFTKLLGSIASEHKIASRSALRSSFPLPVVQTRVLHRVDGA